MAPVAKAKPITARRQSSTGKGLKMKEGGMTPTGEEDGGGAGEAATGESVEQVRDPRLSDLRLNDLPGTGISSKAEEVQVFGILSEHFQALTNAFVRYCKVHDLGTVSAACQISFGAPRLFVPLAAPCTARLERSHGPRANTTQPRTRSTPEAFDPKSCTAPPA